MEWDEEERKVDYEALIRRVVDSQAAIYSVGQRRVRIEAVRFSSFASGIGVQPDLPLHQN